MTINGKIRAAQQDAGRPFDTELPRRNFDHRLSGEWSDHRDCHIRPDLVLVYANQMMKASNSFALAHMASLAFDGLSQLEPFQLYAVALHLSKVVLRLPLQRASRPRCLRENLG